MPPTTSDEQRYQRYARIVSAVASRDAFTLAEAKDACAEEQAHFVTQLVHKLEEDGLLQRTGSKSNPEFRWVGDRNEFAAARWIESKIYNDRITRAPMDDRPRERLLKLGPQDLRLAELLAILIRAGRGGDSALQAGEKIAAHYSNGLEELARAGRGELKAITPAVGDAAYCQIMAAVELGRRVARAAETRRQAKIGGSQDAIAFCRERFARLAEDGAQEEFHIVTLNTKNQTIGTHRISLGALDQTLVHPREVFRAAIKDAAKSILLVHNHPSGDPTPSEQDRTLTTRLEEAGRLVGIQVVDHIIVARDGALSLREFEGR
jgi:DNA repair protein RadC